MKPFKLSPSTLNLMHECPRCFWLMMNKGKKRPAGIFPSLPSGMDGILKIHFDKFMEKSKLPPELAKLKECKNLKLFDNKELLKEWRNSRKGLWFEDKDGNILHGGIDNLLINKENKKIVVLDYKTRGFALKEDTHVHYQNQLDIYNFLLRKMGYETENFSFLLFYHPKEVLKSGEVVFNTDLIKMKVNVDNAENIMKQAIKLLNGKCPKHTVSAETGEACEWCALIAEE